MKKILLTMGVFTSITLNAQSINIENPGFEGDFITINPQSQYYTIFPYQNSSITQGWNLIGNGNADASTKTEGIQSIKLVTGDDSNLANVYNESGTPGTVVTGFLIQGIKGKIQNPGSLKLSFDFKYTKVGTDVGQVGIVIQDTLLTGFADNKTLYEGALDIDATVTDWKSHTIPLTFKDQGEANRVLIVAVSSKNGYYNNSAPFAGSTLWLDNFKLDEISGLNESTSENVRIYPNPVNDLLNIEIDGDVSNVTISSLEGKIISSSASTKIDMSELKSGMYFYRINANGKVYSGNFVKN
jgi:hypothetical protein